MWEVVYRGSGLVLWPLAELHFSDFSAQRLHPADEPKAVAEHFQFKPSTNNSTSAWFLSM